MTVEVHATGIAYTEDRSTLIVVSGDRARRRSLAQRWRMELSGEADAPVADRRRRRGGTCLSARSLRRRELRQRREHLLVVRLGRLTFGITWRTTPSASITNVARSAPQ